MKTVPWHSVRVDLLTSRLSFDYTCRVRLIDGPDVHAGVRADVYFLESIVLVPSTIYPMLRKVESLETKFPEFEYLLEFLWRIYLPIRVYFLIYCSSSSTSSIQRLYSSYS